jgi:hypothetical protein
MSNPSRQPITEESLKIHLEALGARVMSRSGRNEHYGSPREFSFEVRAIFDNGLSLQILARQHHYRDPWEATGKINEVVDVSLLKDGSFAELPRGYDFFQRRDTEEAIDWETFCAVAACISTINPKIYLLQQLTGDL